MPKTTRDVPGRPVRQIPIETILRSMDETNPEVEAMAIKEGKIVSCGSTKRIKKKYSSVKVVDLGLGQPSVCIR